MPIKKIYKNGRCINCKIGVRNLTAPLNRKYSSTTKKRTYTRPTLPNKRYKTGFASNYIADIPRGVGKRIPKYSLQTRKTYRKFPIPRKYMWYGARQLRRTPPHRSWFVAHTNKNKQNSMLLRAKRALRTTPAHGSWFVPHTNQNKENSMLMRAKRDLRTTGRWSRVNGVWKFNRRSSFWPNPVPAVERPPTLPPSRPSSVPPERRRSTSAVTISPPGSNRQLAAAIADHHLGFGIPTGGTRQHQVARGRTNRDMGPSPSGVGPHVVSPPQRSRSTPARGRDRSPIRLDPPVRMVRPSYHKTGYTYTRTVFEPMKLRKGKKARDLEPGMTMVTFTRPRGRSTTRRPDPMLVELLEPTVLTAPHTTTAVLGDLPTTAHPLPAANNDPMEAEVVPPNTNQIQAPLDNTPTGGNVFASNVVTPRGPPT